MARQDEHYQVSDDDREALWRHARNLEESDQTEDAAVAYLELADTRDTPDATAAAARLSRLCVRMIKSQRNARHFWSILYQLYLKAHIRLCLKLVGAYGYHYAEDLVHDAWYKALTHIAALNKEGSFWPWLQRITINCVIDDWRGRRESVLLGDEDPVSPSGDVGRGLEARNSCERILGILSPLERYLLIERHGKGRLAAEIASDREVRLSPRHVRRLIAEAVEKLRGRFGEWGDADA